MLVLIIQVKGTTAYNHTMVMAYIPLVEGDGISRKKPTGETIEIIGMTIARSGGCQFHQ
ncbi:hypothetical protein [Anabaena sp. FACHB-1237]|uniref:hypothetical protein n=1 Tax=Anabaena sp. FACHB-1237 TaxID=2692769 RepID=UPI0016808070|nr:hypothetical protein [Anabaena sp. FACHB-1237]